METIYALSSGALPAGVAVIRLSGANVKPILQQLVGEPLEPRKMALKTVNGVDGGFIDHALVVFFPAPHSYTGEDCAEFHLHGGKAVVARLLKELSEFPLTRAAEAGEFSRRAFGNGKIDLTEAEGLADLIEAETESQRRLAIMGASGQLAEIYRGWRQDLINVRAMFEAELDFSDAEDVPSFAGSNLFDRINSLINDLKYHIAAGERAGAMRDGLKIVVAGAPNAGKSSFINWLAGRDVSIVSEIPGTTRDALEVRLVMNGFPVLITDTAGIRETNDPIERLGVDRAITNIKDADLILVLEDMVTPTDVSIPETVAPVWLIGTKLDLVQQKTHRWPIQISTKTGQNLDRLIDQLNQFIEGFNQNSFSAIPARRRQLELLRVANEFLEQALACQQSETELIAENLRLASNALGRITGDIDVEDILDVIFSEFCIGK